MTPNVHPFQEISVNFDPQWDGGGHPFTSTANLNFLS